MKYKAIIVKNLIQGTEEWETWRTAGIGSSESSVLMDLNPYESLINLYYKKIKSPLAVEKEINAAMEFGSRNEDYVRQVINAETGRNFEPMCFVHEDHQEIRASLDGVCGNVGLEIKCPSQNYGFFNHSRKINSYYMNQLQHHLLTANLDEIYFVSWFEGKKVGWRVLRNDKFCEELRQRILRFWKCVETKTEPNPLDYPKYIY